jgi:alpha-glucosidase (family GH31 glycosyl hydrolase)
MKKLLFVLFFALSAMFCYAQQQNPIVLGKARFTIIDAGLIRMEYAIDGKFVNDSTLFATNRNALSNDFSVEKNGNKYTFATSKMKVYYTADNLPLSEMNIKITVFNKPNNYDWAFRSEDDKNLGGTLSTLDNLWGAAKTDPGLLSLNGWHLIDDSRKEIFVNGQITERSVNHLNDLYFFAYGKDFKGALKTLTKISGEIPMNRKYVHGSWYCRWWDYSSQEFLDITKEFKAHNFPLDVMVMDMGWHTQKEATSGMGHSNRYGWTGYTWNRDLIPDPKKLLQTLKSDNLFIAINDHPNDGLRHHEEKYPEFMKAMGADTTGKNELIFDAGSKKYMDNFFKYALKPSEDIGVDFWWLDWQQDYVRPTVLGFRTLQHLPLLNYLYFNHSKEDNKRGLLFSRWAGWGSQRTPIQFSGDAGSTWDMLKFQIPFTATSSNAGCFYWAHDVGGFWGEKNTELYIRWTQFALTTSSLRTHSVYDENLDRRPWLWGEQAEKAMRKVYHLRSELMPYIYSSVYQGHNETLPLVRSMYIDYPDLKEAYEQPQQYLFGDLLLSAPIVSAGKGSDFVSSQTVWFPPNNTWYDINTNQKYEGGKSVTVEKDIYSFPLFVKGGTPLPMQPYKERMATAVLDTLVLRCYPGEIGKTGSYNLYEDDGISNDYKTGNFLLSKLSYTQQSKNNAIITVEKTEGKGYKNEPKQRVYKIELPTANISKVLVNGKNVAFKGNNIVTPKYATNKALKIIVESK